MQDVIVVLLGDNHKLPTSECSSGEAVEPKLELEDGEGKYEMVGMISHIGKNTGSGHYVAHIKRKETIVYYFNIR